MTDQTYKSKDAIAKELGCSKHTINTGIEAKQIRSRTPKGKTRALYHLGDARAWVTANPPRSYNRARDTPPTKVDESEVTVAEAAEFLGLAQKSVRQHLSSNFYTLTWDDLRRYKDEKAAGVAVTDRRQVKTAEAQALHLEKTRAEIQLKTANAEMAARKNAREAGDVCSREEVRTALSRLAAVEIASEQRLLQRLAAAIVDELERRGVGVGRQNEVAGAVRAVAAREIQALREDRVAALRSVEGLPGLVDEARRLADAMANWPGRKISALF